MIQLYDNGEPVRDIRAWCKQYDTTLVRVRCERRVINPWTGIGEITEREEVMPRICLDWMRYDEPVTYRIIEDVPWPEESEQLPIPPVEDQ